MVSFDVSSQNELFGDKHEIVVADYGKNDEKHGFMHVYSKCAKIAKTS